MEHVLVFDCDQLDDRLADAVTTGLGAEAIQTSDGARVTFAVCAPTAVEAAVATLDELRQLGVRVRGLVDVQSVSATSQRPGF